MFSDILLLRDRANLLSYSEVASQEYVLSVPCTLVTDGAETGPSTGQPVTTPDFYYLITGAFAEAIDATGNRLSAGVPFDQITVSIFDKDSKMQITEGQVDLMTFAKFGQDQITIGWLVRPKRRWDVKFVWNKMGAGFSTQPIYASLNFRGYDIGYGNQPL
jgi:hypothetical protein